MVDLEEEERMVSSSVWGGNCVYEVVDWRCVLFLLLQSCMDFR